MYFKKVEIRWSDLDPNFHLRHSVYYDWGAYCRVAFLSDNGITTAVMTEQNIGPIIFREECVFKKEIKFGDDITVNFKLDKCTADFSKWVMIHEIWKSNETLCALITVDGAWIDTVKRKLAVPGELFINAFNAAPKTETFSLIPIKEK